MRGNPHNSNTGSWTRAAFFCAALVLALLLLRPLFDVILFPAAPEQPSPSPAPSPAAPAVAFFGASTDPFCAPLYDGLEELCRTEGWRLLSYDCRGNAKSQKGQMEDFLRTETADIAVVYSVLEQSELNVQVKALRGTCPVVTVGSQAGALGKRYVAAHVGGAETGRTAALCEYFKTQRRGTWEVLLLADLPDEAAEELYRREFSKENVTILDKNYTWGEKFYAERYLKTGLDSFPQADAIVCTSRHSTAGALSSLRERDLRGAMAIVSLFYDPAMADSLALGDLDAAVALAPKEALERLTELLPKVLKQEKIEEKSLTYHILTPENVDELELGYE